MKWLGSICAIVIFVVAVWYLPNKRTESYFVSYYTTQTNSGFFGNRVFVTKTLNVETLNRMKGLIEEETTNSATVIISIQKLP